MMRAPDLSRPWLGWLLLVSLLFNGLFLGAYAFGEFRTRRCISRCGANCEMSKRLRFDSGQVKAMQESYARMSAQMEPLKREVEAKREGIVAILTAPSPDREALFREVDGIAALQVQVQKLLLTHLLEEGRSLTPAQREEYHKMLKDRLCPAHMCGGDLMEGAKEGRCAAGEPR
jgi:hypothetical protein